MVLITGGTGFLGKYLVNEFLAAGYPVRVLARKPEKCPKSWAEKVEVVEGDIMDVVSLMDALEDVDYVIHAAARVSFDRRDRAEMMQINVEGTANLVNCSLSAEVIKLVHISSTAAIGRKKDGERINEKSSWSDSPLNSDYAFSKYKAEMEVQRGIAEGLPAVILNPGVIVGAGEWDKNTSRLFGIVNNGLSFVNRGLNAYVGVGDVARACRLVLEDGPGNGVRYILSAANMSQKEFFGAIAESLGKKPPVKVFPPFLSMLAGYILEAWGRIRGKSSLINRQSMRLSSNRFYYDGSAIEELGFNYSDIREVIQETGNAFRKAHA